MNEVIFIMGVSGCGKTTIGKLLSKEINLPFFDADDFHPQKNIKKMASGLALNDDDRKGWLENLNEFAQTQLTKNGCVIACSALKQKYRDILNNHIKEKTRWVYLSGSFDLIAKRLRGRKNHFMPYHLLKSQFETLEEPNNALHVDAKLSPEDIINLVKNEMERRSEFGVFGLGVMGKSLCRNLADKGFKISMYNRNVKNLEVDVAENFRTEHSELKSAKTFDDISQFVNSLQKPRRILLMVNAGKTLDTVIDDLLPHICEDDILIDGGNSHYKRTKKRCDYLKSKGIHFIGAGFSGGEKGALEGPSIMPSGDKDVYISVKPFLESIAARDKNNNPCCTYIGAEGSGHFIKMIHNGIEYAEMQLLAEVTTILEVTGQNPDEIAATLNDFKSTADSYLLDITISIFKKKESNEWLVKKILDKAENKGTGSWATIASAELGVPNTLIASALFSRYVSFYKDERVELNKKFNKAKISEVKVTRNEILEAYQFARIINHYQGFKLINEASNTYDWNLNLSEIARIWTNGCIIKSSLMEDFVAVLKETSNILTHSKLIDLINSFKPSVKKVISQSLLNDICTPAMSEALQFLNGMTTAYSSANVIQLQRDFFGAHTYKRLDDSSGKSYHTNWEDND